MLFVSYLSRRGGGCQTFGDKYYKSVLFWQNCKNANQTILIPVIIYVTIIENNIYHLFSIVLAVSEFLPFSLLFFPSSPFNYFQVIYCPFQLFPAIYCPFLLFPAIYCPFLLFPAIYCPFLLFPAIYCPFLLFPAIYCPFLLFPAIYCPFLYFPAIYCPFLLCKHFAVLTYHLCPFLNFPAHNLSSSSCSTKDGEGL